MELTSSLAIVEVRNAFHNWFTLVSRHTLKNITHQRMRHVPGSCNRNIEETSRVIAISCAIRGACRSFYGLSLCLKTQQEAISQKEIVFCFRKDTQRLRKAGILMIFCA